VESWVDTVQSLFDGPDRGATYPEVLHLLENLAEVYTSAVGDHQATLEQVQPEEEAASAVSWT
jgi:hypothetical protein